MYLFIYLFISVYVFVYPRHTHPSLQVTSEADALAGIQRTVPLQDGIQAFQIEVATTASSTSSSSSSSSSMRGTTTTTTTK
jgi:hypothetical protein